MLNVIYFKEDKMNTEMLSKIDTIIQQLNDLRGHL